MEESPKNDPVARLALVLLNEHGGWKTHAQLAKATGIARSQVSEYFEGKRAIPRQALEKTAVAAGFPVYLLDTLLRGLRSFRAMARGRSRADRVFAGGFAAEIIGLVQMATDLILEPLHAGRPGIAAIEDRTAAELWADDAARLLDQLAGGADG